MRSTVSWKTGGFMLHYWRVAVSEKQKQITIKNDFVDKMIERT